MGLAYLAEIRMFATTQTPHGWVPCDGRLLDRDEHEALFALIGHTYGGAGNQFAVPDLRDRMPLAADDGFGLGQPGGAEQHKLTPAELPVHNHRVVGEDVSPGSGGHQPGREKVLCNSASPSAASAELYIEVDPPPPPPPDPPDPGPEDDAAAPGAPALVPMDPKSIGSVGASAPHDNLQPYLTVAFFMNTKGLFPTRP
jgi:microcystin-dependent protein